jgi:hypothetical protein
VSSWRRRPEAPRSLQQRRDPGKMAMTMSKA